MKTYLINVWVWLSGFWELDRLAYKPGWTPAKFALVYLLNHGTHVVLTGSAVVPWSWGIRRRRLAGQRFPKFMDRLLNYLENDHGGKVPGPLWDTEYCGGKTRLVIISLWAIVFGLIVG